MEKGSADRSSLIEALQFAINSLVKLNGNIYVYPVKLSNKIAKINDQKNLKSILNEFVRWWKHQDEKLKSKNKNLAVYFKSFIFLCL